MLVEGEKVLLTSKIVVVEGDFLEEVAGVSSLRLRRVGAEERWLRN